MPDATTDRVPARLRGLPSRQLSMLSMQADRLVGEALAGADARRWHYAVLSALQEFGPRSQAALSRGTGIHTSDVVAVVNELAERGHAERVPDPADRRRNLVTITAQGRRHLRRLDTLLARVQDTLLEPLSGPERAQLSALLTRLLDHHAADAGPHRPAGRRGG